jgi:WD40 repeat protein
VCEFRHFDEKVEGEFTVWDVASGKVLRSFTGAKGGIHVAAFSPDGRFALCGCNDGTLTLWDLGSGKAVRPFVSSPLAGTAAVAFSPDGKLALSASAADKTARVWDVASGRCVRSFPVPGECPLAVAWGPTGRFALTAESGPEVITLRLWEVASGQEVLSWQMRGSNLHSIAFMPDGRQFMTLGSWAGAPRLWDLSTGRLVRAVAVRWPQGGGPDYMALSPDGKRALFHDTAIVLLWDLVRGEEISTVTWDTGRVTFPAPVRSIAFSADSKRAIALRSGYPVVWDVATGKPVRRLRGRADAVALSSDGKLALLGGGATRRTGPTVTLWDVETGKQVRMFEAPEGYAGRAIAVYCVAFSPDGKWALSAGSPDARTAKGNLKVWEVATGRMARALEGHKTPVSFAIFSADGTRILAAGAEVNVWEARTGKLLSTCEGGKDVRKVAVAPNGKWAYFLGAQAELWDLEADRPGRVLDEETVGDEAEVAFSPDGKLLLSRSSDGRLRLVTVPQGKLVREVPAKKGMFDGTWALAFSPDGKLVRFEDRGPRLTLHDPIRKRESRKELQPSNQ